MRSSLSNFLLMLKGGAGSGNFGHGGRPGKVGGSTSGQNEIAELVSRMTWYHGTSKEGKEAILKEGFTKFSNGIFGQGAYMSLDKPSTGGSYKEVLEVKVKPKNVLETEYIDFPEQFEKLTGKRHSGTGSEQKLLQNLGYDGVYIKDEGWLVLFDPSSTVESMK